MEFGLDTTSGIPFYRQIIQQVEFNMSIGKLKPGDKLPTVRSLAVTLKINPNTVAKAYNELELRNLVYTQIGSGTYISDKKVEISEIEKKNEIDRLCVEFITKIKSLGVTSDEILKTIKNFIQEE